MRRTLKYSFSLLAFLVIMAQLYAQEGTRVRGPRISYDLASLALLYFEPERMVYTVSLDYELKQDLYPVIDLGYQHVNINRDNYDYRSNGMFARLGADVNFLNYDNDPNVYEMMYAGGRYGVSFYNQQAENITIPDEYWGDFTGGNVEKHRMHTHWISVVGGLRAEVFKNVFMGWSALINIKLFQSGAIGMDPYNVPGFGKGSKRVTLIVNYTLSYRFPTQRYTPIRKARPK
ncbi:MAG: hypothetical protein KAT31_01880 [Bacteroidales bacterium]|nr:hypothetical protein [Bacteroidales bacterium]